MNNEELKKATLIIALLANFITPFMGSSINIALPEIADELHIDAITSASRKENISGLVKLILDWIDRDADSNWEPDDYMLALKFFPRVNVKRACAVIKENKARYSDLYPNLERLINQIGYDYLRIKRIQSAVEVFKLNAHLYPDSWNVYDSYGEALYLSGKINDAIKKYQKALELNPDSESSKGMLMKLDNY